MAYFAPKTILSSLEELRHREIRRFFLPDGRRQAVPAYPVQPYDRLLFMVSGRKYEPMSLGNELREVELVPGDAWLVRRNLWECTAVTTPHRFISIVPREGYLRVVCYTIPAGLAPGAWRGDPELIHTDRPAPERLLALIRLLSDPGRCAAGETPFLLRAALEVVSDELERIGETRSKAEETAERILHYLACNYDRLIDRECAGRELHLNGSYISQVLKERTGQSFSRQLLSLRLDAAKRLLVNSELLMKEISERCGFSGEAYFVSRFRRAVGITPGRYRALHRPGAEAPLESPEAIH